uniref:23S RNA-specific pseudouridylate synthase n=1 Tax=Desulfovibrio sp. U5L TaxID=596152 RepID=I2PZK2_9BACT
MRDISDQGVGDRREAAVPPEAAGWRLDRATELLWPETGLRGRRRLIVAGAVLVDGQLRGPAYRVRAGEILAGQIPARPEGAFTAADVPVLVMHGDFAAVSKPAGLHSAAIAHGGGQSLDDLLPALFPDCAPLLLSRLDRLTSGIVAVALTPGAGMEYRDLEDAGQVAKDYLAVVHGVIADPFVVDFRLDTADRVKTRVRFKSEPDPLRHTHVEPLDRRDGLTLARCHIAKGARHQIRAHLAGAGHPLVGDPVYGRGEGERLYLHCAALACPVLDASDPPAWTLAEAAGTARGAARKKGAAEEGAETDGSPGIP